VTANCFGPRVRGLALVLCVIALVAAAGVVVSSGRAAGIAGAAAAGAPAGGVFFLSKFVHETLLRKSPVLSRSLSMRDRIGSYLATEVSPELPPVRVCNPFACKLLGDPIITVDLSVGRFRSTLISSAAIRQNIRIAEPLVKIKLPFWHPSHKQSIHLAAAWEEGLGA